MTLKETWNKIKTMDGVEKLTPQQAYSVMADYGVFKEIPRLQTITKIALQNGLWTIVCSSCVSNSDIEGLSYKTSQIDVISI